jgi:hypothetical protein
MAQKFMPKAIAAVLAVTCFMLAGNVLAQGYGAPGWVSPEPNYYAAPTGPAGLTAALYPCPRPTPPVVGQTYITYEALAPHEFLYIHHQCYETANENGVTRTSVTYGHHLTRLRPSLTNAAPGLHTPAYGCRF